MGGLWTEWGLLHGTQGVQLGGKGSPGDKPLRPKPGGRQAAKQVNSGYILIVELQRFFWCFEDKRQSEAPQELIVTPGKHLASLAGSQSSSIWQVCGQDFRSSQVVTF